MRINQPFLSQHHAELERIIERLHMIRLGSGYFEIICPKTSITAFIDEMDKLHIDIAGFSWWCHVTEGHEPCGMSGPHNIYGDGWYSEIKMSDFTTMRSNDEYRRYFTIEYPNSEEYPPCRVPAFSIEKI